MVNVAAFYDGADDRAARARWVAELAQTLHQGDDGIYVNFFADDGEAAVRAAYPGEAWDRLTAIKRIYDPPNVFRRNQNIRHQGRGSATGHR